jgi:hypothetical protein
VAGVLKGMSTRLLANRKKPVSPELRNSEELGTDTSISLLCFSFLLLLQVPCCWLERSDYSGTAANRSLSANNTEGSSSSVNEESQKVAAVDLQDIIILEFAGRD